MCLNDERLSLLWLSRVCMRVCLVSFPDPFPILSGDTAYPSADPGRNAAVGVKYAISNHTTAAVPLYYESTAL